MCGRYLLHSNSNAIAEHFGLAGLAELPPRYNISPGQPILSIRQATDGREAAWLRWGLVPAWVKSDPAGHPESRFNLINARLETAAEKPAYRAAWRYRRCLIPADGFYEWQNIDGAKQPWLVRQHDETLFAIAGLWEHWQSPNGSELESCSLITTEANGDFRTIHTRMPLILPPEQYERWLSGQGQPADYAAFPANRLKWQAVSRAVNNPAHEGPDLLAPLPESEATGK